MTATGGHAVHRSLAPPHIGEALGAVLLGVPIVSVALVIIAVTVIVGGLTMGGRFTSPPPNSS